MMKSEVKRMGTGELKNVKWVKVTVHVSGYEDRGLET